MINTRDFYLLLVDTFRFLESIEYVFVNASEALTGRTAVVVLLYVTTNCISFNRNEKTKVEKKNDKQTKKANRVKKKTKTIAY